jgi:hypothetical protein
MMTFSTTVLGMILYLVSQFINIMLSVVMQSGVMLSGVPLSVILLFVIYARHHSQIKAHYAEYRYFKCPALSVAMLSDVIRTVVTLSVTNKPIMASILWSSVVILSFMYAEGCK